MKFILPKNNDLRFAFLAEKAREAGIEVYTYTNQIPKEEGIFLLPFGFKEEDALSVLDRIAPQSVVFLGKASEAIKKLAHEKNLKLTCLLEAERYLLQNAVHTAEGTLAEMISHTDRRLDQLCLLIYGYGNCGKAIARLMWLCGAEVWVWSRERGQALAQQDGFNVYPAPKKGLGMFDCVINTVPDPIFSPDLLATMQQNALFFQIASGLSGIDPSVTKDLGIRFFPLHGLPGKYCPASEADAIWDEMKPTVITLQKRSTL